MKRLLISLMTITLVAALIGGGIYAAFSDIEASTGNTFTAGTLDLTETVSGSYTGSGTYTVTAGGNGINGNVVFEELAPGENGEIIWTLQNLGNIDGTLTVTLTRTADNDNGINEPEDAADGNPLDSLDGTADGDLDDYMTVEILADLDGDDTYETTIQASAVGGLETICPTVDVPVTIINADAMAAAGGEDTVKIKLTWSIADPIVGVDDNIIQGDGVQLDLNFSLNQA